MTKDANDLTEEAVKVALARNSRSSIMYLLRERLIREVVEDTAPIITRPYKKRIKELEELLEDARALAAEVSQKADPPVSEVDELKQAADDLKAVIEGDD